MPKTNIVAERQSFHRRQLSTSDVLINDLDPDPPIILPSHLHIYDGVIMSELRARGFPNTSKNGGPAKAAKGSTLARKITRQGQVSANDVATLAARINWLQNNTFRWNVRDGYAEYFAAKPARSAKKHSTRRVAASAVAAPVKPEQAAPTPNADDVVAQNIEDAPNFPAKSVTESASPEEAKRPTESVGAVSNNDDAFAGTDHHREPAEPIFIKEGDTRYGTMPNDDIDVPQPDKSGGHAGRASAVIPNQVTTPDYPDKPKTFGKEFPVPKASAFLVANALRKPLDEQRRLGWTLINDPEELAAALAHGELAKTDLLNAFGKLGLKHDG